MRPRGTKLDRGYLISAKDLAAHDQLAALAEAGVGCLKVEGRKKKPEYVATVTRSYRTFLDRVASGDDAPPTVEEVRPLVQIFSRGFTDGMLTGRDGRALRHPHPAGQPRARAGRRRGTGARRPPRRREPRHPAWRRPGLRAARGDARADRGMRGDARAHGQRARWRAFGRRSGRASALRRVGA